MRRSVPALLLASALATVSVGARAYEISFVGGTVHGPGAMVDTPLPAGRIRRVPLDAQLHGVTTYFKNSTSEYNDEAENVPS